MKVDSETFPGAGLQRHVCDNCRKPIVIAWTGRDGEYCSNNCLKQAELKESTTMTDETTGTATQTATENGAPKKKAAKKGTAKGKAKASPKKKAAKKGEAKGTRKRGTTSVKARVQALLERKGGATMKELEKISTTSQRSAMANLRKEGVKIKVTKDKEGVRHYTI
jgi:hypothetical protein